MKTLARFILLLSVVVVLWGCDRDTDDSETTRWTEFVPIVWSVEEDGLVAKPEMLTGDFIGALAEVLSRYGERFRRESGPTDRIYVSPELAADRDLVWNYTTKAQDLLNARRGTLKH